MERIYSLYQDRRQRVPHPFVVVDDENCFGLWAHRLTGDLDCRLGFGGKQGAPVYPVLTPRGRPHKVAPLSRLAMAGRGMNTARD